MQVEILTPEKKVFEGEVEILTVPTRSGYISILSNHAPLVSALEAGEIVVKTKGVNKVFVSERGALQTINNRTRLLLRKCREK
ncbi:MAG: F0F1 ATP synthase subunit epsilon [Candidatus Pacebacteria bacterium]|nr:F0F1 ATP synthase subunit epsilon [Candidatus Paceibacterota bacterium]